MQYADSKSMGLNEGDLFKCEPYLQIKMVNGSHARGIGLVILVGD